jgi:hypothetical protein
MEHGSFVDRLIKILVKRGAIKQSEAAPLRKSFEDSELVNFDEFLLAEGLIEKDDLLEALSELYQVPAFDAVGYFFEHELVRMFPKEFLHQHVIIPLELDQNTMIFVTSDPENPDLLPLIGEQVPYDPQFYVGIREDIIDAIEEFYDQPVSVLNAEFDADYDEARTAREDELAHDAELEAMDIKDIQEDED